MRLLVLQSTSIFENYGGIEYYLDDLLELASEAYGDALHAAVVPSRTDSFKAVPRPYRITAVPFRRKSWRAKFENRCSWAFYRAALAQAAKDRPDFLICGHVSLGPLTALLSARTSIPYLSCVYGIESWGKLPFFDEWALRHSLGILSISHWTKQILMDRGIEEDRIAIVHPRLDTRLENRALSPISGQGPLRLLTVSRLDAGEKYKGHEDVLRALSLLRHSNPELEFRYTIQGDGTDRARLQQLVTEWGLGNSVRFAGRVADRLELENLYRQTDLFVMPSRFGRWDGKWKGEGFGIVYLEAAAFGVPSLAYDCGGVTDIIESERDGVLVPPDDIAALARKLQQLHDDRATLSRLGESAHRKANDKFTRRCVSAELRDALTFFRKRHLEKVTASQSRQPSALSEPPL